MLTVHMSFKSNYLKLCVQKINKDKNINDYSKNYLLHINSQKSKSTLFGRKTDVESNYNRIICKLDNINIHIERNVKNVGIEINNSFKHKAN